MPPFIHGFEEQAVVAVVGIIAVVVIIAVVSQMNIFGIEQLTFCHIDCGAVSMFIDRQLTNVDDNGKSKILFNRVVVK